MKRLFFIFIIIFCMISSLPAMAQELPEGMTGIDGGAYLILKDKNGAEVIFTVHTYEAVTSDKAAKYDSNDKRTASNLSKEAKDLSERLLKIDDVSRVMISYRQVQIFKFPLVPNFDGLKDDIVDCFEAVFD